jgi:hypothetical protein
MYLLTVTWTDDKSNHSTQLGSISHQTRAAQKQSWRVIPAAKIETLFSLELRDKAGSLQEVKPITAETVMALFDEPALKLLPREQRKRRRGRVITSQRQIVP